MNHVINNIHVLLVKLMSTTKWENVLLFSKKRHIFHFKVHAGLSSLWADLLMRSPFFIAGNVNLP